MEFKRYPRGTSRQIVALLPLLEKIAEGEETILCVDRGVLDVIRQLLVERGLWRTTYAISYTETGYYIPTADEFQPVEQAILEFLEDTNMSDCGTQIKAGLIAVANALQAVGSGVCCGAPGAPGGAGTGGAGPSVQPPGETVIQDEPPEGFETWGDFEDWRCRVATWLITTLRADLIRLSGLSLVGLLVEAVLSAIASLLLLPIPGVSLFQVAVTLMQVWDNLDDVVTALDAATDAMICAIVNELDPAAARSAALLAYNDAVDDLTVGADVKAYAKQLVAAMLTQDAVNKAFVSDATRVYPAADCSACAEGPYWFKAYDTGDVLIKSSAWDGTETTVSVNYEIGGGYSPFYFTFTDNDDLPVCTSWTITTFPHFSGQQQNIGCGQQTYNNVSGYGPHAGDGGRLFGTPIGATGTAEITMVLI